MDDTWRAEIQVVTGLLRSNLLQAAAPPVQSDFKSFQRQYHGGQVALNDSSRCTSRPSKPWRLKRPELQSALSQSQQVTNQKVAEIEELQRVLRAISEGTSDFKRRLTLANNQKEVQGRNSQEHIKQITRLKMKNYRSTNKLRS